ncbi:hypothetical protein BO70DRAFT_284044 [Aspergillus heteromorphus CBS 117.55]|uniref:Uncharacterized protein n=1 Tax=Aspergillus heteromorphus CBS 117.55 TaxID=1448321 RepID=A0A317WXT4_9EURO|nr:uncharacterized protein BO70DRAFT_284044 [Aspergillus heteromorphus CBS 117.55]PWY90785.1 hypothetical protein BO70DRAFT_284044 [Aspergillus heteromorphus CBS 117.55]
MTKSALNSDLMRRPRNMKSLSSLFLPCLQARKLRRQRRQEYHTSWTCAGISDFEQGPEQADHHHHEHKYRYDSPPESTELSRLPEQPKDAITKGPQTTASIRLVSSGDSECSTLGPEEGHPHGKEDSSAKQTGTLSDEETDVESTSPENPHRAISMEVGPQTPQRPQDDDEITTPRSKDDLDLELSTRRIPRNPDKKPRPASMDVPPSAAAKLPEIKSRIIEDIPEDVEEEGKHDNDMTQTGSTAAQDSETDEDPDSATKSASAKRRSTWRLSQRKSMIEIFNLLQSTAAAVASAPKLSNLKLPLAGRSPLRASMTSSSYDEPSSPVPPTPPPKSPPYAAAAAAASTSTTAPATATATTTTPAAASSSSTTTTTTTTTTTSKPLPSPHPHDHPDPSTPTPSPTKKQRRMGTAVFPLPISTRKWAEIHPTLGTFAGKHQTTTNGENKGNSINQTLFR